MDDTICAISTSLGVGAISIIRISGSEAINIVNSVFFGSKINLSKDKTINYGKIKNNDEIIDEVLVSVMLGPKSYTKEDVIEINCHGGIATTKKIMSILLERGCRLAEPGEFTKRAFLNGRIDLTQAEAVNDLLIAETETKRKLAINTIGGLLNQKISKIRSVLGDLVSNIEVNIDFPEYEDNLVITKDIIQKQITNIQKELKDLLQSFKQTKVISTGINIALIGSPNVGKSSLLNAFLDEEKAIVTDIAGTTRDLVEGKCYLNDIQINFIDTAGIRKTDDVVEKIGVEKSLKILNKVDLVIMILDNSREITIEEEDIIKQLNPQKSILFINKNDLKRKITIKSNFPIIEGNTKSLDGIKNLKEEIIKIFELDKLEVNNNSFISNLRQEELITKSVDKINDVLKNIDNYSVDMLEIDIKSAWELLGEITGESYQEELLDILFSNFCLGK